MSKTILFCFLICSGIIFQSCEQLNSPGEIKFKNSAIFNIKTGNTKLQLYVYDTFPLNFNFGGPDVFMNFGNYLVKNANISLISGDSVYNNFKIKYNDGTGLPMYFTNEQDIFIKPNFDYSVIVKSNGETITGKLKTIGDFEILNIDKSESSEAGKAIIHLNWNKCDAARFYTINATSFFSDSIYYGGGPLVNLVFGQTYSKFLDTDTVKTVNNFSQTFRIMGSSDSMIVKIGAYDLNSYNYFIKGIKKVGIENAYGYIGSSTIKEKKVYFNNN